MRFLAWPMAIIAALALLLVQHGAATAQKRAVPYYASIAASKARMRTGPGREYPASWIYQRADLPVKVVDIYKDWRKVEDPDGTQGWMQANLLSDRRTAMVRGESAADMLASPVDNGHLEWRAAPGVVGRISKCGNGWCRFDVQGRAGFIQVSHLWGVEATESIS